MKLISSLIVILMSVAFAATAQSNVWVKAFAMLETGYHTASAVDIEGNIYTTGTFNSNVDFDPGPGTNTISPGSFDQVFVQKLDASGNFVWARAFSGGINNVGSAVDVDRSGNVFLAGLFRGTVDFDPGPNTASVTSSHDNKSESYVVKLNSSGTFQWVKTVKASNRFLGQFVYLAVDDDGSAYSSGVYVDTVDLDPGAGTHNVVALGYDTYVQKLNSNGEFVWGFSTNGNNAVSPLAISVDDQNHIYVMGHFTGSMLLGTAHTLTPQSISSDTFVIKLDDTGSCVLSKQIGATGLVNIRDLAIGPANEIVLVGNFSGTADFNIGGNPSTLTSKGMVDAFIVRLNSDLSLIGKHQIGGLSEDTAEKVVVGADGSIYVSGVVPEVADFNLGGTPFRFEAPEGFVMRMDEVLTIEWIIKASGIDFLHMIGTDNILITGRIIGTPDFEPGLGTVHLPYIGSGLYLWNLDTTPVITGLVDSKKPTLYPNPCHDIAYLSIEGLPGRKQLTISDISGRPVRRLDYDQPQMTISLNDLDAGVYIVNILENDGQTHRIKLIKN